MKLSPYTAPAESGDLLIRMRNLVGSAVDVTGKTYGENSRWICRGYGAPDSPADNYLVFTRHRANAHAAECRAAYHHLG
ncbi:hypothetical protein [Streptomyces roseifaciens]|uniref:hypothetical protein n=1 Tax=Streptomyces roseifaciens TaxID=1488406 RepID=UPI0007180737|nr:hypothetical protein [Streptomyces roseifaciens]